MEDLLPPVLLTVAARDQTADFQGAYIRPLYARWLVSLAEELGHWIKLDDRGNPIPYHPPTLIATPAEPPDVVPLPHRRPRLAIAARHIPLPRPRPDAETDGPASEQAAFERQVERTLKGAEAAPAPQEMELAVAAKLLGCFCPSCNAAEFRAAARNANGARALG